MPAVVFVHGGPVPPWLEPKPRAWPSYQAYGAWAASAGMVGVTFDHGFESYETFDVAVAEIAPRRRGDARASTRRPRPDRALGVLGGRHAARAVAPGVTRRGCEASRCRTPAAARSRTPRRPGHLAEAVADAGELPILLTRVGLERDEVATTVTEFVDAAEACGAALDVIDVPNGHHGFDQVDPGEESQQAVRAAMSWVTTHLR